MQPGPKSATAAADPYDAVPCGYLQTTPSGKIVRANRAFLEWTGYAATDVVGQKSFVDLLTPGGRIFHETHYAPLLRMQGFAREIALDVVAADGRRLPALVNASVQTTDGASGADVAIAVFPAPDRREYERELLRARRQAEDSEAHARALARTLQSSLIPPSPPLVPGVDVGAAFRPAGSGVEVGGDFYDVFEIAAGVWGVVIGDVCGKGAEAAIVTALARYTVRAAAMQAAQPHLVLGALNQAVLRQSPDRFCTVAYSTIRRGDPGYVCVTNASGGHPLPVYVPARGDPRSIGRPGTALGLVPDPDLYDEEVRLGRGDVLAFYTDGVTEGRREREFFGESRLRDVLLEWRDRPATVIAEAIVDAVVAFQEAEPRDDIAVVVLKNPSTADLGS